MLGSENHVTHATSTQQQLVLYAQVLSESAEVGPTSAGSLISHAQCYTPATGFHQLGCGWTILTAGGHLKLSLALTDLKMESYRC